MQSQARTPGAGGLSYFIDHPDPAYHEAFHMWLEQAVYANPSNWLSKTPSGMAAMNLGVFSDGA